jgi:hypothetical protein
LKANGHHHRNTKNLIRRRQLRAKEDNNKNQNKWAIFTYTGKETRFITKIFKEFDTTIPTAQETQQETSLQNIDQTVTSMIKVESVG